MCNLYQSLIKQAKLDNVFSIVVGGVVSSRDRFILLERNHDKYYGGYWEFPSGKIEFGETLDKCLHRQILENLGGKIKKISKYIGYFDYVSQDNKKIRQFNFKVTLDSDFDIILSEKHINCRYMTFEEAQNDYSVSVETLYIMSVCDSCYKYKKRKEFICGNRKRDKILCNKGTN